MLFVMSTGREGKGQFPARRPCLFYPAHIIRFQRQNLPCLETNKNGLNSEVQ